MAGPASCFTGLSLVVDLAHCLDGYTVNRLLSVNDINCATVTIPPSLIGIYAVRRFRGYCVLYETTSAGGIYNKGWGFMVVPSLKSHITRHTHISAPHPKFDQRTVEQAAAIFQTTGSNSLLVAGRHRNAYFKVSHCIPPYDITDSAHNKAEPFFDAIVTIHNWQVALDGCPTASCAFIQLHGNARCPHDTVFLSAGLDTPPPMPPPNWYTDSVDRPVIRMQANTRRILPST